MTTTSVATINCRCGHSYESNVLEGIDAARHPDLRDAVLDGTFHQFACPECGREVQLEKLVAYTDFERFHWFALAPQSALPNHTTWRAHVNHSFQTTMVNNAPDLVREQMAPKMLRRLIFGLASLREKLVAFELGLDDRVVEAMKLHMITDVGIPFSPDTYLHLRGIEGSDLVFDYRAVGMAEPRQLPISRDHHDRLAADPDPLRTTHGFLFDEWIVDQRLWHLPPEP